MTGKRIPNIPVWLSEATAPYRGKAAVAMLLGVATLACASLLMFAAGYLISKTALPATTLFSVMVAVAFVQLFGIGRPVLRYFERLISHDWVLRVTSQLRAKLFDSIESKAAKPGERRTTGAYLEYLADDIGHLQNLYLRVAFPTAIGLVLVVLAAAFSGPLSAAIAVTVFAFGAVAAALVPLTAYLVSAPRHAMAKSLRSREYSRLSDNILGVADWCLAGRADDVIGTHRAAGLDVLRSEAAIRRIERVSRFASGSLLGVGIVAIVCVAASAFSGDTSKVNYIAAFALGFFPVVESLSLLPAAACDFPRHADAIARLDDVMATPLAQVSDDAIPERGAAGSTGSSDLAIELREVSYRYPHSSSNVLESLNLGIPRGQNVAILGPSGAGKTTLSLLLRGEIQPQSGTVLIDGTQASAPRRSGSPSPVCYIPQASYVFDQTLRDNLLLGNPNATDEELLCALDMTGLGEKAQSLQNGLDTHIGETGEGLSGGEAHRLSLARALLADSPIVLLDEPFTALDPETERKLLDALFDAFSDKTLVVITHHLAGIERFDRVLFLDDGAVKIDGSPHDLAHGEPLFQKLLALDAGA